MIIEHVIIEENKKISEDIYSAVFLCQKDMPQIKAGQFINVYPKDKTLILPRPISVCDVNENSLRIIYKVVGKGTWEFSRYKKGDAVKIMYPLGNGFTAHTADNAHVLIGGGIGVAPLLLLAKTLKGSISVFLGFTQEPILLEEFKKITDNVFVASENGSVGHKGYVTDLLKDSNISGGQYYACGPPAMLKAVCGLLSGKSLKGQISLEARMGCGFGVCVGCAVKIKRDSTVQYLKACTDGPVFDYQEVLWD